MEEAHGYRYSIHPGATKMYHDLRETYWWPGMKRDNRFCFLVYELPTRKGRTPKSTWLNSNYRYPHMEVGGY